MEANIETLVAEENWKGLEYYYSEADEETKMQYAYYFGMAHLVAKPLDCMPFPQCAERVREAFRISLYDRRIPESIVEFFSSDLYKLQIAMEKQACDYTVRAGTSDPEAAEFSRIGFEHYLILYYFNSSEQYLREHMSKAKIFLIESNIASFINDKCQYKSAWESLKKLLVNMKILDKHFIEAIIVFFRLFNTVDILRKNNQSGFVGYLLEHKDSFSEEEIKMLNNFQDEVQRECLLIFLEMMIGKEDYKKRMLESKVIRAEEVKQFAFKYANCPDNLDSSYFKETLVHRKASDLLAESKTCEAFEVIKEEYGTGLPKNSFLIRELLNEIVAILFDLTGDLAYVVQALKIDPENEKMKEYLLR